MYLTLFILRLYIVLVVCGLICYIFYTCAYIYIYTHIQIQIYAPPHVCRYPLRVPVVILQGAIKCLVLSLFQGSTTASPQLRV